MRFDVCPFLSLILKLEFDYKAVFGYFEVLFFMRDLQFEIAG